MKTQTKFRKVLSVLLSLAFILSMATLPVAVNAYDPITVTASTVEGAAGTDVVVSLSITANSGLATGTMLLKYDTTKLTYKSKSFGPAQGELNGFNQNYATDGNFKTIYYAPVHTEGITEGGVMVNITFTCLAGWTGAAVLELTASEMVDAGYSPLSFSTVNGSVNIPTPVTPKTISFNTAGGTAVASISGMPGTAVTAPADPTKTGFTFAGWSPALPTLFPDADTTLTAQWTPVGISLTVADDSGAVGDTVTIPVSISANSGLAAADLLLTFDNTKLTFVSAVGGTATAGALSSIAVQTPVGGLTTIRQGFALDDGLTAAGTMMIVTFTIQAGWQGSTTPLTLTVEDFFNDDYAPLTPSINNGEVACAAPQTYTITFNTAGGSAIAPVTGIPGTDVPDVADPVKAGFIFTGWEPAIPATFPSNDLTVTAQWVTESAIVLTAADVIGLPGSDVVVTISVTAGSGLATGTLLLKYDTTKLTYKSKTFGPAQGELNGFNQNYATDGDFKTIYYAPVHTEGISAGGVMVNITFTVAAGWTGTSVLELTASEVVDKDYNDIAFVTEDGSVEVIPQSTITFDTAGGSTIAPVTGDVGDPVPPIDNPTKAGYNFMGWSPVLPSAFPTTDLTVVAQWEAIPNPTSTITFDVAGGTPAIAPITQDEGTAVTAPAAPTKAGFTFLGWAPAVPATMPEDDVTCVAQWEEIEPVALTVTDASGGAGENVVIYVNISDASALAAAELFLAFDNTKLTLVSALSGTATAGGISSVAAQPPVGSTTTIKQGFAIDGGLTAGGSMMIITFTINAGWTGTTPLTLTVGDFADDSYNTLPNTIDNGEITFIPAPTSTITFDTDGGSAIAPITQDEGTAVTAPADPTKAGFNFMGWVPAVPATMPEDDVTCVAQWEAIVIPQSTITFDTNGGSAVAPITQDEGTAVTAPANPTKEGYTFAGWDPKVPDTMPEDDVTCFAQWTANSYMVIFEASGGVGGTSELMAFGAAIIPPVVTREGYTFAGWSPEPPATVPVGGGMYYAMWTPNPNPTSTITFNTDGGSPIAPITQDEGTPVAAPAAPTKAGFNFMGWVPAVPATMPVDDVTCVAQWEAIPNPTSTITFNTDGGSPIAPITQDEGTPVAAPAAPTKAGFNFMGWVPAVPATMPVDDLTCVAQWEAIPPATSTITFDTDGGSAVAPITQVEGTDVTAPAAPTKAGFNFMGWVPAVPATMPVDDLTCVAQWEAIVVPTSTITFDSAGGSAIAPITQNEGTAVTEPMDPTRNGYTFTGWVPAVPATMPYDDITCVAQWSVNTYTITFDSMGGTPVAPITQEFGTAVTAPADPTRTGYTFTGWDTDIPATMPSANIFIYAQWTINSYLITFDASGGEGGWSMNMEYGAAITAPVVTREGYTFNRWEPTPPATVEGAATFYAMWDINSYTITFDTDGGSAVAPITQQFGTTVTAPADPTKAGFTFMGWIPVVPGFMPAANTTCVAQWEALPTSTVTFDTAGGSAIEPMTGIVGEPLTAPADPTRAGYTFTGWTPEIPATFPDGDMTVVAGWEAIPVYSTITFDVAGGTPAIAPITLEEGAAVTAPAAPTKAGFNFMGWVPAVPATMPVDDVTCVAQWEAIVIPTSTITFDSAGGSAVAPITQDEGSAVSTPMDPTRNGYTFTGWVPAVPATMPYDDITCVAQWSINTYTLTFNGNGGLPAIVEITGEFGSAVTAPANPTREGYTFTGWDSTVPATMPSANMFIYAQWTINQYTITFDSAGGSAVAPITQDFNTTVIAPADPTKAGFTFMGWIPVVPGFMPAANTTCVAQWEALPTSTVTFDTAGGSAIEPMTGIVGEPLTAPADPTRTGYTFTGWIPEIPATFPQQNLTVTAQWEAIVIPTSTITFDSAGGSAVAPITQDEGTAVTAPADPTRAGYTFNGWLPVVPATMPVNDITCVAQWTLNSYTITWDANGGTGGGTNSCDHGAMPTPISAGTRTGYSFTGWSPTVVEATGPATYTAQWVAGEFDALFYVDGVLYATVPTGFGQIVNLPADPAKAGFTFVQWVERAEQETKAMKAAQTIIMDKEGLILDAEFEPVATSTITFDTAGGSAIAPITGEVGTDVPDVADPTKAGFTFKGWLPVIPATFPEQNLTVVAQWEEILPETSTITFDTAGGSAIAPITGNVGSAVTAPANPTKEGYTFKGWAPTIPGTFPADDLTVVAQWEKNEVVPPTGDKLTGAAIFAAFSLAAAAAFVARKKKED